MSDMPVSSTTAETNTDASLSAPAAGLSEKRGDAPKNGLNGVPPKDLRFWLILVSLLAATFLAALDLTGASHQLTCPRVTKLCT